MEKNNLKIIIEGKAGVGKSTLASLICEYLRGLSFDIDYIDEDVYADEVPVRADNYRNIVDKVKIEIETKRVVERESRRNETNS